jgi:hypothetical protein
MENSNLISLGIALHRAAMTTKAILDAIPEDIGAVRECALVDAASDPVHEIAEQIAALPGNGGLENAVKEMAGAWLEGKFWQRYGCSGSVH